MKISSKDSLFPGLVNGFLGLTCLLSGVFAVIAGLGAAVLFWMQAGVVWEGSYEGGPPLLAILGFVAGAMAVGLSALCATSGFLLFIRFAVNRLRRRK